MKKKIMFRGDFANQMTTYCNYKFVKSLGYEVEAYFYYENKISKVFKNIDLVEKKSYFGNYKNLNFLKRILNLVQIFYSRNSIKGISLDRYYSTKKIIYYDDVHYNLEIIEKMKEEIYHDFKFPVIQDEENIKIKLKIEDTNSVSIHVRRGDYLNSREFKNICTLEYYKNAIKYMKDRLENPVFFIFSNDIEWCKENLNIVGEHYYINWNNKKENNFRDMQLMSLCKNNIIANSSFSWWAALLNINKNKIVVAPKKWTNNLIDRNKIVNKIKIKIFKERRSSYEEMIQSNWITF
ncbi:alpha-1,2-fucosyltransferase [Fusobacterium sp. HC1336]|uniref:alpha-1,2-fucosyltransferase n=1 Tax=Fusobacterium sp. HC1336 TaxID=3171169 RepID=UPI003F22A3E6